VDGHGGSKNKENKRMLAKWWIALAATLLAAPAMGQDVALSSGLTKVNGADKPTFGLNFSYSHDLAPNLAAGFSYINEGHVTGHHRDGVAAQLWLQGETVPGLQLALGAGPYQYFDTTLAETADGFHDAHGTGGLYSVLATWRMRDSRLFWRARIDRIEAHGSPDSTQFLLGVGYRLDQDGSTVANSTGKAWHRSNNDEVVAYAGQTIVNSLESQNNAAYAVEYRRSLGPVARFSATWMKEGDARLIRRQGIIAQGWLEPSFNDDRWTMGIGFGAYFAVDEYRSEPGHISPIVGTTASYNITRHWTTRLNWYRVISNYDRDSDIVVLGFGYRF
jgi:hypothetical protein